MNSNLVELQDRFLKSHWPKCDEIAASISRIGGTEAQNVLIAGLKGKRHHIRSAAIRELAMLGDPSVVHQIEPFLADPSYEVRIDAKQAIKALTGREVLTASGE